MAFCPDRFDWIAAACGLKGALRRAQQAFLGVLDEYTLDQFLTRRIDLVTLLGGSPRGEAGAVEDAKRDIEAFAARSTEPR